MMRKTILLASLGLWLCACQSDEKQAQERLQQARDAYERGDYNDAKLQIDSIKILYPKAFDVRKEGIALMQQVELKEQEITLAYLDSALAAKQKELEAIKGKYVFEKDEEYQQMGHYLCPSQVLEKNLHRSYLRFQVDENGIMSMTSIYCGARSIHHTAVKVTAPDGSFAETPVARDSYETTVLGEKIEKAEFTTDRDGGVIRFLCLNSDKEIRIDYLGGQPYTTRMTPADRQAAAAIGELGQLLRAISGIKAQQKEAHLKTRFIQRKKSEREAKEERRSSE